MGRQRRAHGAHHAAAAGAHRDPRPTDAALKVEPLCPTRCCRMAMPLVLFPVRLETRFFGQELRIRVFPDKIHVDTHEPELTADEVEWGKHSHTLLWNATTEDARRTHGNSWRTVTVHARAAWIVRQLTPTNPAERPDEAAEISVAAGAPGSAKGEIWIARRPACCPINGSRRRSCRGRLRDGGG